MGDDIAAVIEGLNLGPAHIAGISDGGVIAMDMALRRPELARTIVEIGANYRNDDLTLGMVAGLDTNAIERAMPGLAAEFAERHDAGRQVPGLLEGPDRPRAGQQHDQSGLGGR